MIEKDRAPTTKSDGPDSTGQPDWTAESLRPHTSQLPTEQARIVACLDQESGRLVRLAPSPEQLEALSADLAELKELMAGPRLRPEGLTVYPTRDVPSADVVVNLMETIMEDRKTLASFNNQYFRSAQDRYDLWTESPRLYHATLMLDYLVTRYVGWIDPMDLEWFLDEKADVDFRRGSGDYGFSLSTDLVGALEYGRPGSGSFVESLYRCFDVPLPPALAAVKDQSILLGMDASGLKAAFPSGRVFWKGSDENEYCCPMMPADLPEVGLRPLAIVEWPIRG